MRHPMTSMLRVVGHYQWASAISRSLVGLDRRLQRATSGRLALWGHTLQPLLLTSTGHRTGQARVTPLVYVDDGQDLIIVGSNYGRPHHPHWSSNLLAAPLARVQIRGRSMPVHAELVTDPVERARLWKLMVGLWPAYDSYAHRTERTIRVFRLRPLLESHAS
ncbi:nitroreductase/quinone reductase family protein [Actinomadura fulvescens]|uniref:Nitroreductase family deazaflavin-dependent oxidoreductase n=1 Tax=Actinomadura fulvescens TaxID=46160 RepID=A0ABP6DAX5_9ACTN